MVWIPERRTRKEASFGSPPEGGCSREEGPPGFSLKQRSKRRVFGSKSEREAEEEAQRVEPRGRRVRRRPFGATNERGERGARPLSSSSRRDDGKRIHPVGGRGEKRELVFVKPRDVGSNSSRLSTGNEDRRFFVTGSFFAANRDSVRIVTETVGDHFGGCQSVLRTRGCRRELRRRSTLHMVDLERTGMPVRPPPELLVREMHSE